MNQICDFYNKNIWHNSTNEPCFRNISQHIDEPSPQLFIAPAAGWTRPSPTSRVAPPGRVQPWGTNLNWDTFGSKIDEIGWELQYKTIQNWSFIVGLSMNIMFFFWTVCHNHDRWDVQVSLKFRFDATSTWHPFQTENHPMKKMEPQHQLKPPTLRTPPCLNCWFQCCIDLHPFPFPQDQHVQDHPQYSSWFRCNHKGSLWTCKQGFRRNNILKW